MDATVYDAPVMRQIRAASPDLPPALRKVADYILRHPLKAATLTIEELARETATSPAAVNRLAKALAYAGFIGLKQALMATLQDLVSPVDKLRAQLALGPAGQFGLHEQVRVASSNLAAVMEANTEQVFNAVADCLVAARRIYILGFGNSAYLAGLAAANLVPFCADAVAVSMEGGNENAAYRLAAITADDVLLAISLPRYSLDTVQLARYASERGARVVAITDSPASPLTEIADHLIYAPAAHPLLISSNAAVLCVIEGLVAVVMARNKEAVQLSAQLTESVLSYLHVARPVTPAGKPGKGRKNPGTG